MKSQDKTIIYYKYRNQQLEQVQLPVIVESNVLLSVNGEEWITFMCTPFELEALGCGFLFNEGVIQSIQEIASVRVCDNQSNIDIWLSHSVERPQNWERTSGCSASGGNSTSNTIVPLVTAECILPARIILEQMLDLQKNQAIYHETGGIHSSAVSDGEKIRMFSEDIGRHNTFDKLAGKMIMTSLEFQPKLLLTTGRVSSEMLQKAARLNIPILVSRTSPTSLSIQLAEKAGLTLVGYARAQQFNVYTHPGRIIP
jgi:FdhD protein